VIAGKVGHFWVFQRLAVLGFRGEVFVLNGYFDETEIQKGPPATAVGGFLFSPDGSAKFDAEWGAVLAQLIEPFHTSHCAGGYGQFAGWPFAKRDDLLKGLAKLTADTRDAGFISMVLHSDYDQFASQDSWLAAAAGSPYTIGLMACLDSARNYMDKNYPNEEIFFWFEAGAQNEKEAQDFLRRLNNHENGRRFYRIAGYSFVPKKRAPTLCSADFLCWEWQRNYVEASRNEKVRSRSRPVARKLSLAVQRSKFESHLSKRSRQHQNGNSWNDKRIL
jgi:hypothetical protein